MLSLVNYDTDDSDSDNNISDEEEVTATHQNGINLNITENQDSFLEKQSTIKLPQPKSLLNTNQNIIEEDDDEFLHKKEVPEAVPPLPVQKVKQKVQITIPKLSDFKDNEEEEDEKHIGPKFPANRKKAGLLGMLPKPTHSKAPIKNVLPIPTTTTINPVRTEISSQLSSSSSSSSATQKKNKVGLIPYALMDHKKENDKKSKKNKGNESDDSDDDDTIEPFFSFNSKDEDLPQVNEDEIKAMVEKEANRMEERKRKAEGKVDDDELLQQQQDYSNYYQEKNEVSDFDQEAMKALVGGTKAKRSKLDNIQIVDLSDQDVLPDKNEWMRKSLAGETAFIPTGNIDEKGPALSKRKHQISYLAMRAEKNVAELEAMWASNRASNREGRSKYGF